MNSIKVYQDIVDRKESIALVGLGYVGMPIAVSFARKVNVIGFDISKEKIEQYKKGIDVTKEVGNEVLCKSNVLFTSEESELRKAKFLIVAVPTPINEDHTPNLTPLIGASKTVGRNLSKGSIVVFESTVYPGVTEDVCIPILEQESGLIYGEDFKVGYSPERINPGDKLHRLENIVKVVSGCDEESRDEIAKVYSLVVEAGVHKASSIKVAEAAKVIENSQRDINIAFMNELSKIFNLLGIDTKEVLEAAGTKWNFLKFEPGLVGGHCIGVDPYYLVHKAHELGMNADVILSGRSINDGMGKYIIDEMKKMEFIKGKSNLRVGLLGFTFKENCPDTRNTRVIDIYNELVRSDYDVVLVDPEADKEEAQREYGISINEKSELTDLDVVIVAVGHTVFRKMKNEEFETMFKDGASDKLILDIKSVLDKEYFVSKGYHFWRL